MTTTAKIHSACWKQTFDEFLGARSYRTGEPFRPFDIDHDYKRFVDGKPRYDGVRSFLELRRSSCRKGRRTRLRRKSRSAASETEKTDWSSEQYAPEQPKPIPDRWRSSVGCDSSVCELPSSHRAIIAQRFSNQPASRISSMLRLMEMSSIVCGNRESRHQMSIFMPPGCLVFRPSAQWLSRMQLPACGPAAQAGSAW